DGAERGGVQRLDQRRVHHLRVPGPIDRPHAREQIDGLLRRVVEELRDDLDRLERPHDRDQHREVEGGAHDAFARREALPPAQMSSRSGRRERSAHWNSLRMKPETISPSMIAAVMASTMVSTKS